MNNMQKSFKKKAGLRMMADGGVYRSDQNGVPTFTDRGRAAPGATPVTPGAQGGGGTLSVMQTQPNNLYRPPAPTPQASLGSLIDRALRGQQGGSGSALGPSPLAAPAAAPTPSLRSAPPPPVQTLPTMTVQAPQPTMQDAVELSGITSSFSDRPNPFPSFYADGGKVRGKGGPTDDEVGPVMLSDGEYVLPADTVQAVGKHKLDALRNATHKFTGAARGMADGGEVAKPRNLRRPLAGSAALGAMAGAYQAGVDDLQTGYRAESQAQLGGNAGPWASAGADAARTMGAVGDALTFGAAGRIGRGISNAVTGQSFTEGLMSADPRDTAAETQMRRVMTPPAQTAAPAAAPSAERRNALGGLVNIRPGSSPTDVAMGNLRKGLAPGGGFESTPYPNIYRNGNSFVGVGTPSAPQQAEDPLVSELRSALRSAGQSGRGVGGPSSNANEINSRYDALGKELRGMYSARGQGNLARRLTDLEQQRNAALDADARNLTAVRGQDLSAAEGAARNRASLLNTAGQIAERNTATQATLQTAQLKALQDAQKTAREGEEKGFERYNEAIGSMFFDSEGKPDKAEQERFTSFVQASDPQAGAKFSAMAPQDQSKLLQDFKVLYDMSKAQNAAAERGGRAVTNRADLPVDVREATLDDVMNRGLPATDYLKTWLPFNNDNVVVSESGQPTMLNQIAVDANGNWDADKLDLIQKRTGKDREGKGLRR